MPVRPKTALRIRKIKKEWQLQRKICNLLRISLKIVTIKAEAYTESTRVSMMELFLKIVNSFQSFSQKKNLTRGIPLGSKHIYKKIEIFKMKLRFVKSSQLLQRMAFLVEIELLLLT